MRPGAMDIAVPPFPPGIEWAGTDPGAVERVCAGGPLLVHFMDFAQLNSVRSLPYLHAWNQRYSRHGLTVLGVNSPRFRLGADLEALRAGLSRLGIAYPVAADPVHEIWRAYGCEGWPSLFLWRRGGTLAWFHFGEGEYAPTEEAIQEELRAAGVDDGLPEPLDPLRPSDVPGALVAPPSEEVFPGGSIEEPWSGEASGAPLEVGYEAGGAFATADGEGILEVTLDRGGPRAVEVTAPGLYELASHPRHEQHVLALRPAGGVRVWSISFAAGMP